MYKYFFVLISFAILIAEIDSIEDDVQEIIRQRAEHVRANRLVYEQDASISGIRILPEFYENRNFKPAWNNSNNIEGLFRLIQDMRLEGLNPSDYHWEELNSIKNEISSQENPPAKLIADYDIRLSDALVRIVYHLVFGKVDPEELYPNWNMYLDIKEKNPAHWLQSVIDMPDLYSYINEIKPELRIYTALKEQSQIQLKEE